MLNVLAAGMSGRAHALVAIVVSLVAAVLGGWAMVRGRSGRAAIALGLAGIALACVRLAGSTAIGTGSGRLGAIVALVVGVVGAALGGLACRRASA